MRDTDILGVNFQQSVDCGSSHMQSRHICVHTVVEILPRIENILEENMVYSCT